MATETNELSMTQQRDRFVAFTFAASDVLLEVASDGTIAYATGSVRSLLQLDADALLNTPLVNLIVEDDRMVAEEMLARIEQSGRTRDVAIRFAGGNGSEVSMMVCGMKCPFDPEKIQLATRLAPLVSASAEFGAADSPVNKEQFAAQVAHYASAARDAKQSKNLTLYDVSSIAGEKDLSQPENADVVERIEKCLGAWSAGGTPAGKLDDGKYGVVLDADTNAESLGSRLGSIVFETDESVPVPYASLDISEPVEADRFEAALDFAIDGFLKEGASREEILSLARCLEALEREEGPNWKPVKPPQGKLYNDAWG